MTKKVYVLNNHCHDYSGAQTFGELKNVTEGIVPVFKVDEMTSSVKEVLKDFNYDDMLILSGPTILGMIAITYLFARFENINVLVHDARTQTYVLRTLRKNLIIK